MFPGDTAGTKCGILREWRGVKGEGAIPVEGVGVPVHLGPASRSEMGEEGVREPGGIGLYGGGWQLGSIALEVASGEHSGVTLEICKEGIMWMEGSKV